MDTLFEYYNTGEDSGDGIGGADWFAQTFTPSLSHKITSVILKLFRSMYPGILTVSIRATDESGHPTGTDLCSGTINGSGLTTNSAGAEYEITLGAGAYLVSGTKYAIVIRALTADEESTVWWKEDKTSPSYSGGNAESSANSGSSWFSATSWDCWFEEYGIITTRRTVITASD